MQAMRSLAAQLKGKSRFPTNPVRDCVKPAIQNGGGDTGNGGRISAGMTVTDNGSPRRDLPDFVS